MKNVQTGVSVRLLAAALAVVVTGFGVSAEALAQAKKRAGEKAEKAYDPDAPVLAAGGVFKCVDRDGNITYLNVGDAKGCKKIDTESVNTAPFPKASSVSPVKSSTAARTDGSAQRARDTDRKRILQ